MVQRFAIIWLTLSCARFVLAQDFDFIIVDEPRTVNITPNRPAQLIYEAQHAHEVISIQTQALTSKDDFPLDTVITLLNPALQQIAYNDDVRVSNGNEDPQIIRDARLENIQLGEIGQYTLVIDSFNGVSTGEVEVTVNHSNPFDEQIIEIDDTLQIIAELPSGFVYTYVFDAVVGDTFTFTARDIANTIDPLLRILDEQGNVLSWNDDHESADTRLNVLDARIAAWEAAESGQYLITVIDFLGKSGKFELTITHLND